ncbi:hypothetical protein Hypma_007141 [Hypsizygus marmoreus]|uniref:Uncharacterized protein n=1 Tax=Hypsizygus marmoreus TaxID=39966 RepID=A0A369KFP1_HYPMA|nr:hypothetical protein Hypma_007141 [Hypsizygus marmoreus]
MPLLEKLIMRSDTPVPEVENMTLFLPSDVDPKQWGKYGLAHTVDIELKLREGQANDAVAGICNSVTHQMILKETKNWTARGVTQNTCATTYINRVKERRGLWAECYQEVRQWILKLKGIKEHLDFPPLKDEDMYAKNAVEPHSLGDGS